MGGKRQRAKGLTCTATGDGWTCERPVRAKGLCEQHWRDAHNGRPFHKIKSRSAPRVACLAVGEDELGAWSCRELVSPHGQGMCPRHYEQNKKGRTLTRHTAAPRRGNQYVSGTGREGLLPAQCIVTIDGERCRNKSRTGGRCLNHWKQLQAGEPYSWPSRGTARPSQPVPQHNLGRYEPGTLDHRALEDRPRPGANVTVADRLGVVTPPSRDELIGAASAMLAAGKSDDEVREFLHAMTDEPRRSSEGAA